MAMTNNRRKVQRKFNKVMREMNQNLINDNLWHGRFAVRQIHVDAYHYEDGSGMTMIFYVAIIDKMTKIMKVVAIEEGIFVEHHLWQAVNKFIGEDIQAPLKEQADYTKVIVDPISFKEWRNKAVTTQTLIKL